MSKHLNYLTGRISITDQRIDDAIGRGLLLPGLAIIAGPIGGGKSILSQFFTVGALQGPKTIEGMTSESAFLEGITVDYISTTASTVDLLRQFESISIHHKNIPQFYVRRQLRLISRFNSFMDDFEDSALHERYYYLIKKIYNHIYHTDAKVVVLDSISDILDFHTQKDLINDYFRGLRQLVNTRKKLIIATLTAEGDNLDEIKNLANALFLTQRSSRVIGRDSMELETIKNDNASRRLLWAVDPSLGLKEIIWGTA